MRKIDTECCFCYLKGFLIGIPISAVCLCLAAVGMMYLSADRAFAAPLATLCLAIGSFFTSYFTAYKRGEKGWAVGLLTGGIYFVIITFIGLLARESGVTLNSVFHLVIILLSGLIGGIVGVNRKDRKKYI